VGLEREKCIQQFAQIVVKNAKFPSNPRREDLYIVRNVGGREEV
jgi:hypothetical protein